MKVRFIYQCRRCTARTNTTVTFATVEVETTSALALLELSMRDSRQLPARDQQPMLVVHDCSTAGARLGDYGVADLIGVERV